MHAGGPVAKVDISKIRAEQSDRRVEGFFEEQPKLQRFRQLYAELFEVGHHRALSRQFLPRLPFSFL